MEPTDALDEPLESKFDAGQLLELLYQDAGGCERLAKRAEAYEVQGRWKEAAAIYELALSMWPDNAALYNNLGIALEEAGDPGGAERAYLEALELRPELASAHSNLAALYEEQGQFQEAIEALAGCIRYSGEEAERAEARARLVKLDPDHPQLLRVTGAPIQPGRAADLNSFASIEREVRNWALALLLWSVLNILLPSNSAPFGIMLILMSLASFYFRVSPMMLVFATVLVATSISNLFVGGFWAIFWTVLMALSTVSVIRKYRVFRQFECSVLASEKEDTGYRQRMKRASAILPWAGLVAGGLGLAGVIGFFIFSAIAAIVSSGEAVANAVGFGFGMAASVGMLGLGMATASLISRFRYRAVAVLGVVAGALAYLSQLGLILWAKWLAA